MQPASTWIGCTGAPSGPARCFQLRPSPVPTLARPLRMFSLQQRECIPRYPAGHRRPDRPDQTGVLGEVLGLTDGRRRWLVPAGSSRRDAASAARSPRPRRPASGTTSSPHRTSRTNSPHGFLVPITRACSAADTNRSRSRSLAVTQPRATAWSYSSSSRPVSLRSSGTTSRRSGLPAMRAAFGTWQGSLTRRNRDGVRECRLSNGSRGRRTRQGRGG